MNRRLRPAVIIPIVLALLGCSMTGIGSEARIPQVGESVNIAKITAYQVNDQRNGLDSCSIGGNVTRREDTYWISQSNRYMVIEPIAGQSTTNCKPDRKILSKEKSLRNGIEQQAANVSIEATQRARATDCWEAIIPTPTAQRK